MRASFSLLSFGVLSFLAGCALSELQHDNAVRTARVDQKTQELGQLQAQQRALVEEQKNLLSERDRVQIALNEVETELTELKKENAQIKAENEVQRKKKEDLERQIRQYEGQISALRNDNGVPDTEKRKRIEELKEQIKAHLKIIRQL